MGIEVGCAYMVVGEGKRGRGLRSCHTRKGVETVRFRFQKRYVAQKVSKSGALKHALSTAAP